MRSTRCFIVSMALALGPAAWAAPAKDGDPTPRKGMDPADAALIKQFEARRWLGSLAAGKGAPSSEQVRTSVSGSIPGKQSCSTQIGPSAPGVGPAGQPTTSPRFGQTRDSVVLVTGNVINVCR